MNLARLRSQLKAHVFLIRLFEKALGQKKLEYILLFVDFHLFWGDGFLLRIVLFFERQSLLEFQVMSCPNQYYLILRQLVFLVIGVKYELLKAWH